ncbi:MAG: carbon storage regulator, partial [Planctomycetales bacterium]|nr:carbon storage regulator [Planctomycetales bacterium]
MLVLSRKAQEKIRIGENITITILRTKGKTVRVGVEAPNDIQVLRGELVFEDRDSADPEQPQGKPARETGDKSQRDGWSRSECVSHQRVSRDRVTSVLPAMLGESAPLRAMLDRR